MMSPTLFIFTESMDHLYSAVEEEERMSMELSNHVSQARPESRDIEVTPREISSLQGYEFRKRKSVTGKQALSNIIFLGVISMTAGWLGVLLNKWTGDAQLALLAFLAIPPLGILALNIFFPDRKLDLGLEFKLKKNWIVYLCAFLIFPVFTMIVLFAGRICGFITFTGFIEKGICAFIGLAVISFFSDFIKNCLEEFTWRGFFSRQFEAAGVPTLLNHLLTGMIWLLWQVPYWLFLLDRTASGNPEPITILMVCLSLLASSIVYGEIRLLSRSTWPTVLLRASLDAVSIPLILHGFISIQPSAAPWLSPDTNSIAIIILFCITGVGFHQFRTRKYERELKKKAAHKNLTDNAII